LSARAGGPLKVSPRMRSIDAPSRALSSDQEWIEFYADMRLAKKAVEIIDGAILIDDMIKLATDELKRRNVKLPQSLG
jgi:hypothetical protein